MRRPLCLLALMTAVFCCARAQTLSEYLKLRRHYGISQAAGVEALETFVGTRVAEIKGVVKGTFRVGQDSTILVERSPDDTISIESPKVPDWLTGGEVRARLLVRATRASENSELHATLLGAATEQDVAAIDREVERRAQASLAAAQAKARRRPGNEIANLDLPASTVEPIYARFIQSQNHRLSSGEADLIARGIIGFSVKYGVDARLIMAMVMVESGFDPHSTSSTGAQGLGQLMPGTARGMGVSNSYDTVENLYGTVRLIRGHLDMYRKQTGDGFQSLVLALAAYNAGVGAVKRHNGVPPFKETQAYVRRVVKLYAHFAGVD